MLVSAFTMGLVMGILFGLFVWLALAAYLGTKRTSDDEDVTQVELSADRIRTLAA